MAKQPIPIREVVRLSRRSRQAVYKAIEAKNLIGADLFGVKAVVNNQKLVDFIRSGRTTSAKKNGNKRSK